VRIGNTAGLYHGKWQGKPAWIEIFVDKTMYDNGRYRWVLRVPFIRDIFLSNVLFHEIGHHIHATAQPEYREKEDVADQWKVKLQKCYMRSRYPMLLAIVRLMRPLINVIEPLIKPSDEVIRSIEGRRR
jgi:hypothetical protein